MRSDLPRISACMNPGCGILPASVAGDLRPTWSAFARQYDEPAETYDAKISPSRWIEFSTRSCGSPGHWHRMMK
jgi:hypothetical protein